MDETTLHEIAFFPSTSSEGQSKDNLKTSLQVYDNLADAKTSLVDVAKNFLKELLNVTEETRFVVCNESNPDIKYNHKLYPTNSVVLIRKEDLYTIFEKKKIINAGYIYNSESHRVVHHGTISVTTLGKLSPSLIARFTSLKDKENNLEILHNDTIHKRIHAINLMRELSQEKAEYASREAQLDQREKMLDEWDNDLDEWEMFLEKESKLMQSHLTEYQSEIAKLEAQLAEYTKSRVVIPQTIQSETESDSDENIDYSYSLPPPTAPVVKQQPPRQIGYLEELEEYLVNKWGKIESSYDEENDNSYLKYIESMINPGKRKISFGKVKP